MAYTYRPRPVWSFDDDEEDHPDGRSARGHTLTANGELIAFVLNSEPKWTAEAVPGDGYWEGVPPSVAAFVPAAAQTGRSAWSDLLRSGQLDHIAPQSSLYVVTRFIQHGVPMDGATDAETGRLHVKALNYAIESRMGSDVIGWLLQPKRSYKYCVSPKVAAANAIGRPVLERRYTGQSDAVAKPPLLTALDQPGEDYPGQLRVLLILILNGADLDEKFFGARNGTSRRRRGGKRRREEDATFVTPRSVMAEICNGLCEHLIEAAAEQFQQRTAKDAILGVERSM